MKRQVLCGLSALLLLHSQTVLGNPQRTLIGERDGLLSDNDPDRDPLGATVVEEQRNGRSAICCRCVSLDASCNTDLDGLLPDVGLTCKNEIESEVFGCDIGGVTVSDIDNLVDLRSGGVRRDERCLRAKGQKTCCDPVTSTFNNHINMFDLRQQDEGTVFLDDTEGICQSDDVGATQNFKFGPACGKRDSRVYFDAGLNPGFTNPGEWPWAVLIYAGQGSQKRYVASGALVDNDVVVTVGHKMRDYVGKAEELVVHVGDWDPNTIGGPFGDQKEKHLHVENAVDCVRIHERADLDNTLENNVAVLKLRPIRTATPKNRPQDKSVIDVISLKTAPRRRGDEPNGPPKRHLTFGERDGLLSDNEEIDGLGAKRVGREDELPLSYINTVCLPTSKNQFTTDTCWVAAWGSHLERQREVDIPLLTRSQCQRVLEPVFRQKGVNNWRLKESEICAGGIPGKDTCEGEGGAPLVCYSKDRDQYFAVGLTSYGFGCNSTIPAIYTNLMDSGVQGWIKQAFGDPLYCEPSPF